MFVSTDARRPYLRGVIGSTVSAYPRGTGSNPVEANGHFFPSYRQLYFSSFSDTHTPHTHTHTHTHNTHTHTHLYGCDHMDMRHPPPSFFSLFLFLKCFNFFLFLPCFSRLGQTCSHKVSLLFHLEYHSPRNAVQLPNEKSKCLSQWNGTSLPGRRLSQNVLEKYHPLKNAVQ